MIKWVFVYRFSKNKTVIYYYLNNMDQNTITKQSNYQANSDINEILRKKPWSQEEDELVKKLV